MGYSSSSDRRKSGHSSSSGHRGRSRGRGGSAAAHRSSKKKGRSRSRPSRRQHGRSRSRSRGRPLGSSNSVTDYYSRWGKKKSNNTRGGRSVNSARSAGSRSTTRSFGSFTKGLKQKNRTKSSTKPLYDDHDLEAEWYRKNNQKGRRISTPETISEEEETVASLDEILTLDAETAMQSIEDAPTEEKENEDETTSHESVSFVGSPEAYDPELSSPIALLLFCCGLKEWLYATDMKTTYDKTTVAPSTRYK